MEKEKYRNSKDRDGSCQESGENAHSRFEEIAKQKGFDVSQSSKEEDIKDHIDCFILKDNKKASVDVKAMKKSKRNDKEVNAEWVWIEYVNVMGDKGWLYGKADIIAFEQPEGFIVANRNQLKDLCEEKVPFIIESENLALSPQTAQYKLYKRGKDWMTQIHVDDIKEKVKHHIWVEDKSEDKKAKDEPSEKWELKKSNKDVERELSKSETPLVSRLAAQRDIPVDVMKDFLGAPYESLEHPHTLTGVEEASKIFCDVALNKGSVSVIGDYDCDGVVSGTMIHELCRSFGLGCNVFLPSRLDHGYGLNEKSVKAYKEKVGTPSDLLIVVDCGSNNYDEIAELKEFGTKHIIIIDHHIMGDRTSSNADVLINWRSTQHGEMCTTGQIYMFIRGIRLLTAKINPIEFLTYAAIGTIGDCSPLIGDNRIIVKHGLCQYAKDHVVSAGLNALLHKSYLHTNDIGMSDISFKVVPKINASGRIAKPDLPMNLLVENDNDIADFLADEVTGYNDKRKKIQKEIETEAVAKVKANLDKFKYGIFVSDEKWHVGVVGIIASRLVETFDKPAVVIGSHNGLWKGSGRTVEGINLKAVLDKCPEDTFSNYGGHEGAVGVTVGETPPDDSTIEAFNDACKSYYEEHDIKESANYYDAELKIESVSRETAQNLIDRLYPYGVINPEPIFLVSSVTVSDTQLKEFATCSMVSFNIEKGESTCPFKVKLFNPKFGTEVEGTKINLYFSFPQNIETVKFSDPCLEVKHIEFI
jgi:single-stranded-DNA-specific exonuclease